MRWWLVVLGTLPSCTLSVDVQLDGSTETDAAVVVPGPDAGCTPTRCASLTVVSSIGTNGRDFDSVRDWELSRGGSLPTRRIYSVTPGTASFEASELVLGTSSGCAGNYVPNDEALTNGATLGLDDATGVCQPGETFVGQSSGAMATNQALVNVGTLEIGEMHADSVFDEAIVIDGSTTDANHYMRLTAASDSRHFGVAGAGVVVTPPSPSHAIAVLDDYTQIAWVEVTAWTPATEGSYDGINIAANNVLVEMALIHDDAHGTALNSDANGITVEADDIDVTVRNSMIYNIARSGVSVHAVANSTLHLYNSTLLGCTQQDNSPSGYGCIAITDPTSGLDVVNTISMGSAGGGVDFKLDPASPVTGSNNISSDGSAIGADSITGAAAGNVVVSSTNLHLTSGSPALAAGLRLEELFTDDIDGETRPPGANKWDIGADQQTQ